MLVFTVCCHAPSVNTGESKNDLKQKEKMVQENTKYKLQYLAKRRSTICVGTYRKSLRHPFLYIWYLIHVIVAKSV